ncbi:FKBP-type peptidyl-prolyl cis-trans isomerase [Microbacterium sp. bgisy203]|uniref:FKBP-type peptidyl-prolyl cis-trans isomerase n=1 Tax=Microbacterium sp. bgisy203 TaxID=3413799 RepID=UPI003D764367
MRLRPIAALSAAAVSVLLLAGCAGSGDAESSPSPSGSSGAADACLIAASPGSDSDAVTVDEAGDTLSATVPSDLAFEQVERTVVTPGDGADLGVGDLVSAQYQVYDGASGELINDSTTTSASEDGRVPVLIDQTQLTMWVGAIECNPLGSTVVMTVPGSALGTEGSNYVVVARTFEELPTTATGQSVAPVEGMPEVALADDGEPTITVPDTAAPADLQIEVLKKGDGPTVAEGDQVTVQYKGVAWDTKEEFDSSWKRGAPAAFTTTGVYEGFGKAMVGQTVGSQVLVVMPPSMGDLNGALKGKTLVFVIDILGTQHAPTAATQ